MERNILDLAARQGLSLYTKDNSAGTLTAGPLAGVEKGTGSPSKKVKKMKQKGDFIFRQVKIKFVSCAFIHLRLQHRRHVSHSFPDDVRGAGVSPTG